MNRKITPLAAICLLWVGCVHDSIIQQTNMLTSQIRSVRAAAITCAPVELAEAEARIDFGIYASEQGRLLEAYDEINRATSLVSAVLEKSSGSGCEGDRDGDGVVDTLDRCPDIPEDFDNENDEDGCPDFDRDKDGVPDDRDRCPQQAEDKDGFQDQDGCPEFDNDRDGLPDKTDQCPLKAEDFDGYRDLDGCPDTDNDGDDIADADDKCPTQAGPLATGGCPDDYRYILFRNEVIELKQQIKFERSTGTLRPRSFKVLNELASALKRNPRNVLIEGHTDSEGASDYNEKVSKRVAILVKRYLVKKGIPARRLKTIGMGENSPIDDNETAEGRASNCRVEFKVIK